MTTASLARNEQLRPLKGCLAHLEGDQLDAGIRAVAKTAIEKIKAGCTDCEFDQAVGQAAMGYLAKLERSVTFYSGHGEPNDNRIIR